MLAICVCGYMRSFRSVTPKLFASLIIPPTWTVHVYVQTESVLGIKSCVQKILKTPKTTLTFADLQTVYGPALIHTNIETEETEEWIALREQTRARLPFISNSTLQRHVKQWYHRKKAVSAVAAAPFVYDAIYLCRADMYPQEPIDIAASIASPILWRRSEYVFLASVPIMVRLCNLIDVYGSYFPLTTECL